METPSRQQIYPEDGALFYSDEFGERMVPYSELTQNDALDEALLPLQSNEELDYYDEDYIERFEDGFGEMIGSSYPQEVLDEINGVAGDEA